MAAEAIEFGDRWVCACFGRLELHPMVLEMVLSNLRSESVKLSYGGVDGRLVANIDGWGDFG